MNTNRICAGCQRPVADDAPQGLCPECLMKAGLGSGVSIGAETNSDQAHFIAPSPEELAGKFPQLEILGFIGQGGMGAVYKARQKHLDRVVALKILPPGIGDDPAFAERFTREAKALGKLDHPGIVAIHEFGKADGLFFFVMEFVDGVTLRQLLQTSRISSREALAIVPQICDALQFAHDHGIVHRDIKPENVLIDRRGRVKVADFGLAKLVGEGSELVGEPGPTGSTALTEAGKVLGTPNYIAPEQVEHPGEVDHRADIYALGVVLYQMLTGELPGQPLQPPSRKVQVDVRLDEIVLRALERNPSRRYQRVSELKTQMETIAQTAEEPSSPTQGRQLNRRETTLAVGATIFFVATAFVMLGVAFTYPQQAVAPLMVMGMCALGLVICLLHLAGRWPFSSGNMPARETMAGSGEEKSTASEPVNGWQPGILLVGGLCSAALLLAATILPRPANWIAILFGSFGLVVSGLKLAGLWPFPSGVFPKSNFTRRNLRRS